MIAQKATPAKGFLAVAKKYGLVGGRSKIVYSYSVLFILDPFGTGYICQPSAYNNQAMDEGWTLITDGLMAHEAVSLRDDLKDGAVALGELVY